MIILSGVSMQAPAHNLSQPASNQAKAGNSPRFGLDYYDRRIQCAPTLQAKIGLKLEQFLASTIPYTTISKIEDLTPHRLAELGDIRGIIFDLDDTLMPLLSGKFPEEIIKALQHLKKAGYKMGVVTNNIQPEYCHNAREQLRNAGLQMPFIEDAQKPDPRSFLKMRDRFGLCSSQMAVVGDGFLSDIRCANLLDMKSVQATWFTHSSCGHVVSYLQDTVTTSFNCLRNFLTERPHPTIIEPHH